MENEAVMFLQSCRRDSYSCIHRNLQAAKKAALEAAELLRLEQEAKVRTHVYSVIISN
jgi:hypothetical protein